MSILYLAHEPCCAADRLADELDADARRGNFFTPALVVVPHRYLRKWLKLALARRLGIAINLQFEELEDALWKLLAEVDPRQAEPTPIDENVYRLLVLSVLLEESDPHLARLRQYLQMEDANLTRLTCRRAWYLADRLGLLLRDYEYHRQDLLVQRWLQGEFGLGGSGEFHKMMERAQRALFHHITRPSVGRRALLSRLSKTRFKTFPQYALELMQRSDVRRPAPRLIHFFGFTHLSDLHARTIAWLGQHFEVRFHHVNALACRLPQPLTANALRDFGAALPHEQHPAAWWGRAGSESLALLARLLDVGFATESLRAARPARRDRSPRSQPATVLTVLQGRLREEPTGRGRLDQDASVQIVGCPGTAREFETVYNSIVHNLQNDPSLRQTDIAVLVTDMPRYRAALQAIFERPPRRIQYNLVDFNAAGSSMFGQALAGMLDLALESFSRSRVFHVILNPCFLARLGVDRTQATTWLDWADRLGIYHGWDADEKHEQGYARSPFYAWRLGLQRLRLGRFMEVVPADGTGPAPRFGHVIPFADVNCSEREQLDAFCRAVEGLLPILARLRTANLTGDRWAHTLTRLVQEFLEVPEDRPEEAQVRAELLQGIDKLSTWDAMHASRSAVLPLALVREYVASQLEVLEGSRGDYLVGGVTIAALQPMRPVPFRVLYVVGLGEDLFPGSNALSSFDLRGAQRATGDIRPAEQRLYDFLTAILAAQQKLYLLYNNHDLQKDQPLLPSVPLLQLQRYLKQIVKDDFHVVEMPTQPDDVRFLDPAAQPAYQDVLVQYRDAERCLAILAAERDRRLVLDLAQQDEWSVKRAELAADFSIPPTESEALTKPTIVSVRELGRFLNFPAAASLRRHLGVVEPYECVIEDEEPLVTPRNAGYDLVRQTIEQLVASAGRDGARQAIDGWPDQFKATYAEWGLRNRVPEDAFGDIDRAALQRELAERIRGEGRIEAFLLERVGMAPCGPVLLGESTSPIGARLRFPALRLRPGHELPGDAQGEVRLVGFTPFAWQSPRRFEVLIVTNHAKIEAGQIARPLFEPVLLYLALLASTEPNAEGISAQTWLTPRDFVVHVSYTGGIQTWTYPARSIAPTEATRYLAELCRDFLDPRQFELLPFELLCKNRELRRAFDSASVAQIVPAFYRQMLEDALTEERESQGFGIKIPTLVQLANARVPADALVKVQRRFQLLDRGPALIRQQPRIPRRRKAEQP